MTSKIKYQKNYTEFNETYQLVLPLSLEGVVPDDDSVRLLSHELEELDYTLLYQAYSAKGRNPAVDPKAMFKILTYAYSQNIYSSRKMETTCYMQKGYQLHVAAADIFPDRNDVWTLVPFLKTMEEKLGYRYPSVIADSGYEREEGYSFLRESKMANCVGDLFIKEWFNI